MKLPKFDKELRFWTWSASVAVIGASFILTALVADAVLAVKHRKDDLRKVEEAVRQGQAGQGHAGQEQPHKQVPLNRDAVEEGLLTELEHIVLSAGHHIFWHLVRDVGIALIVSVGIVILLEHANRKVLEAEFEDRLRDVGTKTIAAVFGNDHPQELLKTVRQTIFEEHLLREDFEVKMTLWRLKEDSPGLTDGAKKAVQQFLQIKNLGESSDKLVAMQVETEYAIRNVSDSDCSFDPPFGMEAYFHRAGTETCRIESVKIGSKEMVDQCGKKLEGASLQCRLPEPLKLAPGERRKLSFSAFAIRHLHDDEVWCAYLLTFGMTATLVDYTGLDLDLVVQRLTPPPESKDNLQDRGTHMISLSTPDIVLPFQTFVMNWAPRADLLRLTQGGDPSGSPETGAGNVPLGASGSTHIDSSRPAPGAEPQSPTHDALASGAREPIGDQKGSLGSTHCGPEGDPSSHVV